MFSPARRINPKAELFEPKFKELLVPCLERLKRNEEYATSEYVVQQMTAVVRTAGDSNYLRVILNNTQLVGPLKANELLSGFSVEWQHQGEYFI